MDEEKMGCVSTFSSQPGWQLPSTASVPPRAGGPNNEASNEPLMCNHAYANEEKGALGQFTTPPPSGWASAGGGAEQREREGAESRAQAGVAALESSRARSQI